MFFFDGFNEALLAQAARVGAVLFVIALLAVAIGRQLWKHSAR